MACMLTYLAHWLNSNRLLSNYLTLKSDVTIFSPWLYFSTQIHSTIAETIIRQSMQPAEDSNTNSIHPLLPFEALSKQHNPALNIHTVTPTHQHMRMKLRMDGWTDGSRWAGQCSSTSLLTCGRDCGVGRKAALPFPASNASIGRRARRDGERGAVVRRNIVSVGTQELTTSLV